jgi:hypothetical protein
MGMTKLEEQIERAMRELLEENEVPEIPEPDPEIISERVERTQKKRDTQKIRESRKLFRRWRKQSGL